MLTPVSLWFCYNYSRRSPPTAHAIQRGFFLLLLNRMKNGCARWQLWRQVKSGQYAPAQDPELMHSLFCVLPWLGISCLSELGSQSISNLAPASGLGSERLRIDLNLPDSLIINRIFYYLTNPGVGSHSAGLFPAYQYLRPSIRLPSLPKAAVSRGDGRKQGLIRQQLLLIFLSPCMSLAGRDLCGNASKNILKTCSPLMRKLWWLMLPPAPDSISAIWWTEKPILHRDCNLLRGAAERPHWHQLLLTHLSHPFNH